jgi:hypothetical protein
MNKLEEAVEAEPWLVGACPHPCDFVTVRDLDSS